MNVREFTEEEDALITKLCNSTKFKPISRPDLYTGVDGEGPMQVNTIDRTESGHMMMLTFKCGCKEYRKYGHAYRTACSPEHELPKY